MTWMEQDADVEHTMRHDVSVAGFIHACLTWCRELVMLIDHAVTLHVWAICRTYAGRAFGLGSACWVRQHCSSTPLPCYTLPVCRLLHSSVTGAH
jgi:hypothetical protein